jgi:hypothetical protein
MRAGVTAAMKPGMISDDGTDSGTGLGFSTLRKPVERLAIACFIARIV